jgi:penicillin-binding protein-related factor A (putative recombinase)
MMGKKIKLPLEKAIQKEIIEYLWNFRRDLVVWRNNNITWQNKKGHWISSPYIIKGVSDIIGFDKKGRFVAIEVKRTEKSDRSKDQIAFIERIVEQGGISFFTWSTADCIEKLKERGL